VDEDKMPPETKLRS